MSDPTAEVTLNEYMVACYGTTEYSEDMSHITLKIDGPEEKTINYEYKCREEGVMGAAEVSAVIPEIETRVSMTASDANAEGYVKEGYAFSPMFTLGYRKTISDKEVFATWLNLAKACPSCFLRDLDIDMFYNKETGIYSCIRCQYRGTEEDVLEKNEMIRFRYKAMHDRITKFDFD